jgi:hypothetical protein
MNDAREAEFRELLDDYGILRPGGLEPPQRSAAFTVFAQRTDARLETDLWARHASQFFESELKLTAAKRYVFDPPQVDAAHVVITTPQGLEATRLCYVRPRENDDLRAAEVADSRAGNPGMSGLARRCKMVWLVELEGEEDEAALRIAAILASVVLGPILSPDGEELFGVRTARAKLEKVAAPYR